MPSKKQSEFPELSDPTGAHISSHRDGQNYKIPSSAFARNAHSHTSSEITNVSQAATGATVSDALDGLRNALDTVNAGVVTYDNISGVPGSSLVGRSDAAQGAAQSVPIGGSLEFTLGSLNVKSTTTPAEGAIPEGGTGGSLAAWVPDASGTTKGIVQFGGDLATTSTATAQAVTSVTAGGTSYTLGPVTDGQLLARSGTSIVGVAAPTAATVTSQENAEAGTNNTEIMSPLRTKQAVTAYGLLKDFTGYVEKTPVAAADTVLIADSADVGTVKRALVSSLVSGASGLAAATDAQALALALATVGITPANLAALDAARGMFSVKAKAVNTPDVQITSAITVLEPAVQRVFLPPSDGTLPTVVLYNDAATPVSVYPNEGRPAGGAYFNGNTAITFPRSAALGGLETGTLTQLTGLIEFTVDAWPPSTDRILFSCRANPANDLRGIDFRAKVSASVGSINIAGFQGGTTTESLSLRSTALTLSPNTLVHFMFSLNLSTNTFQGYIDGVENAFNGIPQVFPTNSQIAMPAATIPFNVGSPTTSSTVGTSGWLGNIFRMALYHNWFLDLSDAANRALLMGAGRPAMLGKTGWRPRGSFSQPASLYLNGVGDGFRVNQAPNFDATQNVTGGLIGSATVPAPPNNATLLSPTAVRVGQLAAHSIKGKAAPFSLPAGSRASFTLIEGTNTYVLSGGA